MKHHKPKYRYVSRYRQQSENEQNIQPTSSATEQQTPFQNRFSDSSSGGTCLGEAKIVNQFEAILNSCIDEVVANPEILCRNPGRDFTRNRKISAGSIIKFLITADGKCLKKLTAEFLHMQGIEYTSYQSFGLQRAKLTDTVFL